MITACHIVATIISALAVKQIAYCFLLTSVQQSAAENVRAALIRPNIVVMECIVEPYEMTTGFFFFKEKNFVHH